MALENDQVPKYVENNEISINYVTTGKSWNQNEIIVDNIFAYTIALDIIKESEHLELKSVEECQHKND